MQQHVPADSGESDSDDGYAEVPEYEETVESLVTPKKRAYNMVKRQRRIRKHESNAYANEVDGVGYTEALAQLSRCCLPHVDCWSESAHTRVQEQRCVYLEKTMVTLHITIVIS